MPQIAQISEIFASQLFWLLISFGLIYLVIGRGMVPKIEATVDRRNNRITEDLAAAERARAEADATDERYRARMEASRAEATKITVAAKEAASRETAAKLQVADSEIEGQVAEAEARIRAKADEALASMEEVAAEAAQDIVARISGVTVSSAEARNALEGAFANGR